MTTKRKTRKRPVYAKIRQLDWLMWRFLSEQKCCFCDAVLFEGTDTKTYNNVTIHHLEGSRSEDNLDEQAPIDKMLFAHSACHKAYHLMERHLEKGYAIDHDRFKAMEKVASKHKRMMEKKANV
jgi:hypothetical protein